MSERSKPGTCAMRRRVDVFARRVFLLAALYGLTTMAATFFLEDAIERASGPLTHPEYFYGFTGTALAWQFMFLVIAADPGRYRLAALPAVLEKLGFAVPVLVLVTQGRSEAAMLPFAAIDLGWAAAFAFTFWRLSQPGNPDGPERSGAARAEGPP